MPRTSAEGTKKAFQAIEIEGFDKVKIEPCFLSQAPILLGRVPCNRDVWHCFHGRAARGTGGRARIRSFRVQDPRARSPDGMCSAWPFCQGDRAAVGRSRIPIARTRRVYSGPNAPSRSRIRYRGAVSHGIGRKQPAGHARHPAGDQKRIVVRDSAGADKNQQPGPGRDGVGRIIRRGGPGRSCNASRMALRM
jgi:hypothetical protein